MAGLYENLQSKAIRERCCPCQPTNFDQMTGNPETSHIDRSSKARNGYACKSLKEIACFNGRGERI